MKKYKLKNLDCANCAAKIEEGVRKLEDVKFVAVSFANLSLTIDTDNLEKVKKRIKEIEPEVEVEEDEKWSQQANLLKTEKPFLKHQSEFSFCSRVSFLKRNCTIHHSTLQNICYS